MTTLSEFLRHELPAGQPASVVLRSGFRIDGVIDAVDLVANVVRIDGWSIRVDEVAGARSAREESREQRPGAGLVEGVVAVPALG